MLWWEITFFFFLTQNFNFSISQEINYILFLSFSTYRFNQLGKIEYKMETLCSVERASFAILSATLFASLHWNTTKQFSIFVFKILIFCNGIWRLGQWSFVAKASTSPLKSDWKITLSMLSIINEAIAQPGAKLVKELRVHVHPLFY